MCISGCALMAWLQLDSFLSPPSSCLAAAEIKMHPWFKDVDWQNLAKNKAAFVPNVQDVLDTSYFLEKKPVSAKVREGQHSYEHVQQHVQQVAAGAVLM